MLDSQLFALTAALQSSANNPGLPHQVYLVYDIVRKSHDMVGRIGVNPQQ
jgi:hypothetical protein